MQRAVRMDKQGVQWGVVTGGTMKTHAHTHHHTHHQSLPHPVMESPGVMTYTYFSINLAQSLNLCCWSNRSGSFTKYTTSNFILKTLKAFRIAGMDVIQSFWSCCWPKAAYAVFASSQRTIQKLPCWIKLLILPIWKYSKRLKETNGWSSDGCWQRKVMGLSDCHKGTQVYVRRCILMKPINSVLVSCK